MEISGEDGSKITVKPNSKTVFGRGSGFNTTDRTVSRCHVVFSLKDSGDSQTEPRVCFEVVGKNPIWVRSGTSGQVQVFRRFEKGDVGVGDCFCVGGQRPVWFAVERNESEEEEKMEMEVTESSELSLESGGELESIDVSNIDPVKEFGFLVIGHEFDQYRKQRIRDINNWDWFLEEPRKDSDEDDEVSDKRKKRGAGRKRRKVKDNNDDEDNWMGESEEDEELITKVQKFKRPAYSTRSKDRGKTQKAVKTTRSWIEKKTTPMKRVESEDEDDPTLGGFIVDGDNDEVEQDSAMDEEEEEFIDDDVDDD